VTRFPKGKSREDKNYISVFLHNSTDENIDAKYVLSFLDANKSEKILKELGGVKKFYKDGYDGNDGFNGWGWQKAIKKDEISLNAPNDTFTLIVDITIIGESKKSIEYGESESVSSELASNYHHRQLAQDFSSLLISKHQSDIVVKCGEKLFDCHQVILASRSQVFKAMFESNMKEKLTGSVEVKNIDHEVFEDLLKYIYSGEAPNIEDHPEELLAAADQYQLEKLKEHCEVKVCPKLDVSNCIDLLVLGDLHHASTLKAAALKFVSKNMNQIESCEWEQKLISNPTLMAEVLKMMLPKVNNNNDEVKKRAPIT